MIWAHGSLSLHKWLSHSIFLRTASSAWFALTVGVAILLFCNVLLIIYILRLLFDIFGRLWLPWFVVFCDCLVSNRFTSHPLSYNLAWLKYCFLLRWHCLILNVMGVITGNFVSAEHTLLVEHRYHSIKLVTIRHAYHASLSSSVSHAMLIWQFHAVSETIHIM